MRWGQEVRKSYNYRNSNTASISYHHSDHLGNIILAYCDLNGDGYIQPRDEVLEENRYFPLVWTGESAEGAPAQTPKQAPYTQQSTTLPFGYNGAEWKDNLGLHLTTYRTMAPEVALWGQVDPKAEWDYGTSPYASMRGNPISCADPYGDIPVLPLVVVTAAKIGLTVGAKVAIGVTATTVVAGTTIAATGGFAGLGGCPTCPPPGTYGTYNLPTVNVYANPPSGGYYDQSVARYGYNGTFEQWGAQYGYEGMSFQNAVCMWQANHSEGHAAWVAKMDGLEAARSMMYWMGSAFPAVGGMGMGALPYGVAAPNAFSYPSGYASLGKVNTVPRTSLNPTHNITKSKAQMKRLYNDFKASGIKDPIKFVEHNGARHIVNGHHRFFSAQKLGIRNVPAQRVSLPYKGYRSPSKLHDFYGRQPGYWKFFKR